MSELYAFSTDKMATLTKTVLADGRIEITGKDTFALRDQIKARGGKWDAVRRVWTVPAGTSLLFHPPKPAAAAAAAAVQRPREATGGAGGKASTSKKSREEWTREEWQAWSLAYRIRNRGRVECCCSAALWVGEPCGPMIYACERHGETRGSFTGD